MTINPSGCGGTAGSAGTFRPNARQRGSSRPINCFNSSASPRRRERKPVKAASRASRFAADACRAALLDLAESFNGPKAQTQFIRAFAVVTSALFDGIARVNQIDETDAFDHTATIYVQTRDDTFG